MPRLKKINITQKVCHHLKSYSSITRAVANQRYGTFDLPDVIRRVKLRAEEEGYRIELVEKGNTKYKMSNKS